MNAASSMQEFVSPWANTVTGSPVPSASTWRVTSPARSSAIGSGFVKHRGRAYDAIHDARRHNATDVDRDAPLRRRASGLAVPGAAHRPRTAPRPSTSSPSPGPIGIGSAPATTRPRLSSRHRSASCWSMSRRSRSSVRSGSGRSLTTSPRSAERSSATGADGRGHRPASRPEGERPARRPELPDVVRGAGADPVGGAYNVYSRSSRTSSCSRASSAWAWGSSDRDGRRDLFRLAPLWLAAFVVFLAVFPVEGGRVDGVLQVVGASDGRRCPSGSPCR